MIRLRSTAYYCLFISFFIIVAKGYIVQYVNKELPETTKEIKYLLDNVDKKYEPWFIERYEKVSIKLDLLSILNSISHYLTYLFWIFAIGCVLIFIAYILHRYGSQF